MCIIKRGAVSVICISARLDELWLTGTVADNVSGSRQTEKERKTA
jgi:hypothetical protein